MSRSWDERIADLWESADDRDPEALLVQMRRLVDERPDGDPDASYEWASACDFVGREAEAIPHYRAALRDGLAGDRRPQAVIQLASSLRNVGETAAAIELLGQLPRTDEFAGAADAFLALALHDAGRGSEALGLALRALAATLPRYGRAVAAYADELPASSRRRE